MTRKLKAIGSLIGVLLVVVWFRRNPAAAVVLIALLAGGLIVWRRRGLRSSRVCEWCRERPAEGRARFCSPRCRAEHRLEARAVGGDELAERRLRLRRVTAHARPDDEIPF